MDEVLYTEEIRSKGTTLLFILLTLSFYALFGWRLASVGFKFIPGLFVFLGLFFTFYVFNYRTLKITITDRALRLNFGVVRWRTEIGNMKSGVLYNPPFWIKYGGAGVHFASVGGIYMAFYTFLEGPRIKIDLHQKQGWVQALVFSTQQPEQILDILGKRIPTP